MANSSAKESESDAAIRICVLGATGSVGVSTLQVLALQQQRFRVVALTANKNYPALYQQCMVWRPEYAVLNDQDAAVRLGKELRAKGSKTEVLYGQEGLVYVATLSQVDYVMAAIVGAAGLAPTLAAAQAGKRVLLANKEALVMAGELFLQAVHDNGCELLPVDSEHNALFQCMPAGFAVGQAAAGVNRLLLTASGGPFLHTPLAQLANVSPQQACAHPKWQMGQKISVDSATMMNKGLEVIEACWLFSLPLAQVQVLIHPQSIVHSFVEYVDGSTLAQLGNPDMCTPIACALSWPKRMPSGVEPLDLCQVGELQFSQPDEQQFPCLRLAREAFAAGGTASVVLNAANEVAVQSFLQRRIGFLAISRVVAATLEQAELSRPSCLATIMACDQAARQIAAEHVKATVSL